MVCVESSGNNAVHTPGGCYTLMVVSEVPFPLLSVLSALKSTTYCKYIVLLLLLENAFVLVTDNLCK